MKSYERLDAESDAAWDAFLEYRDMGPKRSFAETAVRSQRGTASISRWRREHDWESRVRDYDRDIDVAVRKKQVGAIAAMKKRQLQAANKLMLLGVIETEKLIKNALGQKHSVLDQNLLAKMVKTGAELERINRDQPTDIIETRGDYDYSKLDTEELAKLRELLMKSKGGKS